MSEKITVKTWFESGSPWVWLNAGGVAVSVILVIGLIGLIASRGLGHFWPAPVFEASYTNQLGQQETLIGEIRGSEPVKTQRLREAGFDLPDEGKDSYIRHQVKTGNRDVVGLDFRFALEKEVADRTYPEDIVVLERTEWGNFYGYLVEVRENGKVVATENDANRFDVLEERIARVRELRHESKEIEKVDIGAINHGIERIRLKTRGLELDGKTPENAPQAYAQLAEKRAELDADYKVLEERLVELYHQLNRDSVLMRVMDGQVREIQLSKAVVAFRPNAYGFFGKIGHYFEKLWEFVADEPREANTEGGIFPAIFGTIMMVLVMTVLVTPFGVVAALYLREYATQGTVTKLIRVAVNNLAGVPSIVYGVFGLGFFVYFLGGSIDALFFPEAAPAPVFGTPGLMWASLTLALLTLPVVIVSTEEGLARIPRAVREGSLALGATKIETLMRVVIPMASPGIMTGLILAVARAAGEVAPLMLVGVVKLAPSLPLDGNYPFLHLDRKFMHLGFHIYDVGFQSPNVEAARPLVYATALLLVLLIIGLNLAAVSIRNRLREKYRAMEH
ncbi:MAG: phosphate ABC transporter permease PstA [Gammaproteobacteria bacterium]|nr:phosphate ABC transporter permease PstA [Gammaproteobacteria bacterium]